jgi:hypothetical protein
VTGHLSEQTRYLFRLVNGYAMDLLAEIRAAFPALSYPGDAVLSDCWCDECEFSVRNLRGKSWRQVRLEDFNGENAQMSPRAFRYYLPGLLCLAVQHPDELDLACEVNARLIVSDLDPPERAKAIRETLSRLSVRQRRAVARFLQWLGGQGWQAPILVEAALKAVKGRRVEPYSHGELMAWCQTREAENFRAKPIYGRPNQ